MREFRLSILNFYKAQLSILIKSCTTLDKQKTAFAITSAILIGITPLFGFTFILATGFGLAFRLNQVIMQTVHLMMSPFQFLLFYPFIKIGKMVFNLHGQFDIPIKEIPDYIRHHTQEFIAGNLKIFLAGGFVWAALSMIVGYLVYKLVLKYVKQTPTV
jgi:uncharacterized protein (DUF2062 family)